jgi:serine/threonine protein kinase
MAELRACNVIHRDLNLSNVFLDGNFEPRIADFGLVRMAQPPSLMMTHGVGTPVFMAPELLNNDDNSVDVYAFAILLYRLFCEDFELDGDYRCKNIQQTMLRIVRGARFKHVPAIPAPFWTLIQRCWAEQPKQRPSFKDIVAVMRTTGDLALPETDLVKYHRYQTAVSNVADVKQSKEVADSAQKAQGAAGGARGRKFNFVRNKRPAG